MMPVLQTNAGGRGNCMAACWASILEVTIDSVPDYRAIHEGGLPWLNAVNTWLTKHHARVYVELEPYVSDVVLPLDWHLINYGTRERGHSVVGFAGRPVWDPLRGASVDVSTRPYNFGLLVHLDPALRETWQRTWRECLCPACIKGEG